MTHGAWYSKILLVYVVGQADIVLLQLVFS